MKIFLLYSFIGFVLGYFLHWRIKKGHDAKQKVSDQEKDFNHAVIHELRAYITNLNWIFEKLIDKGLGNYTEDQYSAVISGKKTVENANSLVNDILNAISVGRVEAKFKFKLNDINKIIENILSEYQSITKQRKIDLSFIRSATPIPLFFFDDSQMYVAIHDLIHNSVKYTRDGGKITVRTIYLNNKVLIAVEDNGIGVPANEKSKIFTKFFRADNAKKIHSDGSGLGIYMAKNIVAKHNGEIDFQSEENRGTTVKITIPILTSEPKENAN